jgi:hypothetical protein
MTTAHPLVHPVVADEVTFEPASPVYQVLELTVSPKLALAILEQRAPNRNVRDRLVRKYARDMKGGHWLRNGETIKFDRFGRLLDGQHRLWAVAEADVAVDFTVVLGLEPEAMATVDTGAARKFHDVLAINGMGNSNFVATLCRNIWLYEHGYGHQGDAPSHLDLAAILSRFPTLPEWASTYKGRKGNAKIGQPGTVGFTCFMAARLDSDRATQFADGVVDGRDLEGDSPIYHLRERLLSWRSAGLGTVKVRHPFVLAVCIKAWNAFLAGRRLARLQYSPTRELLPVFDPPVPGLRTPAVPRLIPDRPDPKRSASR